MSVGCCHTGGFSNWSHKLVWQSADGEKNVNKPAATLRKSRGAEDACDWTEKGVASLRKKRTFEDVGTIGRNGGFGKRCKNYTFKTIF